MEKYSLLFSIVVKHSFFSNGLCRNLEFIPTDICKNIIENSGLIMKKNTSGIQVFYDETKTEILQLYMNSPSEALKFCFKLYSRDSYFLNYTEPLISNDNSIIYFHNRGTQNNSSHDLLIQEERRISEIKDILSKQERLIKPLLIIGIYARAKDDNIFAQKEYTIKFNRRKTFWKYYIFSKREKENLYIDDTQTDLNNKINFEQLKDHVFPNNRLALTFRSQSPIPLQEKSCYRFQLKEKNPGNGKVLVKWLPVASSLHISKEKLGDKKVTISEIFLTIN